MSDLKNPQIAGKIDGRVVDCAVAWWYKVDMNTTPVKPTNSVKIDAATYRRLRRLSKAEDRTMLTVLRRAVAAYEDAKKEAKP